MAQKADANGKVVVKDFADVDLSQGRPAEVVIDQGSDNDEVTYEGGELDGQRGEGAAEDKKLLERVEARRAEIAAKEAKPKEEAPTVPDPEAALPELEVDPEVTPDPKVTPPVDKAGDEPVVDGDEPPAYTPNLTYKAYGQEKKFPDWASAVVTTPEVEGEMRTLFAKADGLDEMKPKFQEAAQQRDQFKGVVDEHVGRVQRLMTLRDKAPAQFFEEMGVPDELILRHARRIVEAREDPAMGEAFNAQREAERMRYALPEPAAPPAQLDPVAVTLHQQEVTRTFADPAVKGYAANFDKLHGEGAFQRQMNERGSSYHRTQNGRYVPPSQLAQELMTHFGSAFATQPAPSPIPAPAAGGGAPASAARTPSAPARPKTVPRVGHGANASPAAVRLKSLDEVKKKVAAELNG